MANNTPSPFTNQRLFDLVRQQRIELRDAELISDEEYLELAKEHAAVARLENYGDLRERIRTLEAERSEDTKRLDWLERQCPVSICRVLDLRNDKTNTVTTWIIERHTERFGCAVTHPPIREALDAARKGATEE